MHLTETKRVIVIGCPGSGKSVFSRALQKKTGLPLYHLDLMFWNEDRTTVPKEEFRRRLSAVLQTPERIIDGNYGSTMEMRFAACDTVVFLDYPTEVCLSGIRERRGKPRPDMPWIETGEDAEFIAFIRSYNRNSRPQVLALMEQYPDKHVLWFHERDEANRFLAE
ncbi:MAG: adenylate kinase [Clostridia bacterium]|nr:adenylate kinase [Clostridia bacterium]